MRAESERFPLGMRFLLKQKTEAYWVKPVKGVQLNPVDRGGVNCVFLKGDGSQHSLPAAIKNSVRYLFNFWVIRKFSFTC